MTCPTCLVIRRRVLMVALSLLPARAFSRPPPGSDPGTPRAQWFANQKNMMGGSCCQLGDGHELDPGDLRYDEATGLYSVRLPDPSERAFGRSLDEHYDKPKVWVEVPVLMMRDPVGGPPPRISNPVVWFDTGTAWGTQQESIRVYCLEPNTQF